MADQKTTPHATSPHARFEDALPKIPEERGLDLNAPASRPSPPETLQKLSGTGY